MQLFFCQLYIYIIYIISKTASTILIFPSESAKKDKIIMKEDRQGEFSDKFLVIYPRS